MYSPKPEDYLDPPHMRSDLLYAYELVTGDRVGSITELRKKYPHLPRPLPLNLLAREIEALRVDPRAWERYKPKKMGAPVKRDDASARRMAARLRKRGLTLRAIAAEVGRSHSWVKDALLK